MLLRPQFRPQGAQEELPLPLFIRWVNQRLKEITSAIPILNRDLWPELDGEVGVKDMGFFYGEARRYGVRAGVATSQHTQINNAITSIDALGGGEVRLPAALGDVYVAQSSWYTANWDGIRLVDVANVTLVIERGCTVRALDCATSNHSAVIGVQDASQIRITGGGTIVGERNTHSGPSGEDGHVIALIGKNTGCTDITIDNLTLTDAYGDGIFVGISDGSPYSNQQWNRRVTVQDIHTERCRRQGMSVVNVIGMTIDNFVADDTGGTAPGAGIDFEPQFGYLHYPATGTPAYAPVEDVVGTNIRCNGGVYGVVITGGAKRVRLANVSARNNTTYGLYLNGAGTGLPTNQETNDDNVISGVTIDQDDPTLDGVTEAIRFANGSYCRVSDVLTRGGFKRHLNCEGSGVGFGKHTIANVACQATADTEIGIRITNTAHEIEISNATVRGAQQSMNAQSSRLKLRGIFGYDAVGVSGNANAADISIEGDDIEADLTSTRAANVGVQVASSDRLSGTLRATLAGRDGVNLYDVQHSPGVHVVSSGNGQTSASGYYDCIITGGSSTNRVTAHLRPIAGVPTHGLLVAASAAQNDLRGSDMRGYTTADYVFSEPSTIYEREPGTTTRGDSNVTLTAYSAPVQRFETALTANRTVRVNPTSLFTGWTTSILRTGLGAFTLTAGVPKSGSSVVENNGLRYVPFSGQVGQYASTTPVVPIPNGTGTIVVTALLTNNAWTTSSGQQYIAAQDDGNTAGQRGWGLCKSANGLLSFSWSTNGTSLTYTLANSTPVPGAADGVPIWVRATIANSGGNVTGTFATAAYVPGSVAIPGGGSWTNYGSVPVATGTSIASMHLSTYPLEVGGIVSGGTQVWDGDVYRMQVTVGAATSVDFNPNGDAADGVSTWVSANTETWTLHGASGATVAVATLPSATAGKIVLAADDTGDVFLAGYEEWP